MKMTSRKLAASTGVLCMLWLALLLSGCSPEPDTPLRTRSPGTSVEQSSGRFEVTRVGIFADDLAYGERRGIYVIRDTETGAEYVGISGVGISEVGSHTQSNGKTAYSVQDER